MKACNVFTEERILTFSLLHRHAYVALWIDSSHSPRLQLPWPSHATSHFLSIVKELSRGVSSIVILSSASLSLHFPRGRAKELNRIGIRSELLALLPRPSPSNSQVGTTAHLVDGRQQQQQRRTHAVQDQSLEWDMPPSNGVHCRDGNASQGIV